MIGKKKIKIAASKNDAVFYTIVTAIMTLFFIMVLYPVIYVVSASFSSAQAVQSGRVVLFPVGFSVEGYRTVFNTSKIWIGYRNTILYTVFGTMLNVAMTMTTGYCMSRKDLPGRKGFMMFFMITMFFGGGMIPTYLLIRGLGMLNTPLVMIIPGAMGVYTMIVAKTFIQNSIPGELLEAATIDGCSDIGYYLKIVLPLSNAILAVQTLNYGVGHWNAFFNALIYLNNQALYPLTVFLREILMASQIDPATLEDPEAQLRIADAAAQIKYALIVVTLVPVIMVYPFVQKHFVKGVMVGSVKG